MRKKRAVDDAQHHVIGKGGEVDEESLNLTNGRAK